jgi:hypothetical protein
MPSGSTPIGSPTSVPVAAGAADANHELPAGAPIGTYTIQGVFNPTPDFSGSTDTSHNLTVTVPTIAVSAVSVRCGSEWATLRMNSDGVRLLPQGRSTDIPWFGIDQIGVTLGQAAFVNPGDVSVTGITTGNYGPATIADSGTSSVVITLARPITAADRVTLTIGNGQIVTFTGRPDVLPGDANDESVVNTTDGVLILHNETPAHAYDVFYDLNGDGATNGDDFTLDRSEIDTVPPEPHPMTAVAALDSAAVEAVLGAIDPTDFAGAWTSAIALVRISPATPAPKREATSQESQEGEDRPANERAPPAPRYSARRADGEAQRSIIAAQGPSILNKASA